MNRNRLFHEIPRIQDSDAEILAKMNRNPVVLGITVVCLLLMGWTLFFPFGRSSHVNRDTASDFYQRHPTWIWTANTQDDVIPMTGNMPFPDNFERLPNPSLTFKSTTAEP